MTQDGTGSTLSVPEDGSAPDADAPVLVIRTGAVATIRLNRPEAMNALDGPTKEALRDAVTEVAADPQVRCVVLAGSGRAFCVGQDLREHAALLRSGAPSLWRTVPDHYNPIALALATMPKPVIAAVNGIAAGAGASFCFAADLRIMAESAGFNLAFAGIGLSADSGATWWLPRLIGPARALQLLLMPRTVAAAEALTLGLASEVVPDADLPGRVAELAGQLASGPTLAYGALRRAVAYSAGHDLEASLIREAELMQLTGASSDHRGAVEAFLARQPPRFEGH